jgi:DNA-binding transcriptional LysR family regulator
VRTAMRVPAGIRWWAAPRPPTYRRRLSEQRAPPYIDLSIVKSERPELESELSAGALDVVVDVQLPLGEEIRRRRLCGERLGVVARWRHPSVSRGLNPDTYLAQEHILVTQRRRGLSAGDYELNRQNLRRGANITTRLARLCPEPI